MSTQKWETGDYPSTLSGPALQKLIDSGIAPVVAVARGYVTLNTGYAKVMLDEVFGGVDSRSSEATTIKQTLARGGALFMPWFGVAQLRDDLSDLGLPSLMQLKPDVARPNTRRPGKFVKYELASGSDLTLSVHPSTPVAWLRDATRVACCEGLLKADALTTSLLLHAVQDSDALRWTDEDGDVVAARQRLRNLMENVEPDDATLVIATVSCSTWGNSPDWATLRLRGREAWIGFDGDTKTNYNVWNQTRRFKEFLEVSKHATQVQIIDLSGDLDEFGDCCGLDDVLAGDDGIGWEGVLERLTDDLPPKPERPIDLEVGHWRVNEAARCVEECVQEKDAYGQPQAPQWVSRAPLAGRVTAIETLREPTVEEMRTGRRNPDADSRPGNRCYAEYELEWFGPKGEERQAPALGTDAILEVPPKDWTAKGSKGVGQVVPGSVKRIPGWPFPEKGHKVLEAWKAHRQEDTVERTAWTRMGWVPTDDGTPAFIIGRQAIGANGDATKYNRVNLENTMQEDELDRFGVEVWDDQGSVEEQKARARALINELMTTYLDAWGENLLYSLSALAAMFRPVVPLRNRTAIYLPGPPGCGKSFWASFVMAGWAKEPRNFTEDKLTGSAKDTFAVTQQYVGRSVIHVVDDLALSSNRFQSEKEEASAEDVVRGIRNGGWRKRMTGNLEIRYTPPPHALAIITAENVLTIASARQRTLELPFQNRVMADERAVNAIRAMRDETTIPQQVVGLAIKWLSDSSGDYGPWEAWESQLTWWTRRYEQERRGLTNSFASKGIAKGPAARRATSVADIYLGMRLLVVLAEWAGLDQLDSGMHLTDVLIMTRQELEKALTLAEVGESADLPRGKKLPVTIATLLRSGKAHVKSALDGKFPIGEHPAWNTRYGWELGSDNSPRAQGECIGYYMKGPTGVPFLALDKQAAFRVAQQHYAEKLKNAKEAATWDSVAEEGLIAPKEVTGYALANKTTIKVSVLGARLSLAPLTLDAFETPEPPKSERESDDELELEEIESASAEDG